MKSYTMMFTFVDRGLPYPDKESAEKDARELAAEIASEHMFNDYHWEVIEEDEDED